MHRNENVYIGREVSWLRFNERVLLQAVADDVPLLERLRFLAIFSSNLDEFFMVRAGCLHDRALISKLPPDNKTGLDAAKQLEELYLEARRLYPLRDEIAAKMDDTLRQNGVARVAWEELSKEERQLAKAFFKDEIAPLMQVYRIDSKHPFPHLENKALHVFLRIQNADGKTSYAIAPMPRKAPHYLTLSRLDDGDENAMRYIISEDVLLHEASGLFRKQKVKECFLFRITRNADIDYDENLSDDPEISPDYPSYMKLLLKRREKLGAVRLEWRNSDKVDVPRSLAFLSSHLGLSFAKCYRSIAPLSYEYVSPLIKDVAQVVPLGIYRPIAPLKLEFGNLLERLEREDILLAYPYHSMRTYLDFLREAIYDPRTKAIAITLYRLAEHSQIISFLSIAAERGIHVTAVVELKARFDEENNIHFAHLLESSGCRVIYGMNGLKVHSKVTLITMCEEGNCRRYAHIGTGNYNEETAKQYTDLGILTADPDITSDCEELFRSLRCGIPSENYKALLVSPMTLREGILREIEREGRRAMSGKSARICMKMNSLTDKTILDALINVSRCGVKVDLIVRGICCLVPGIRGLTDNIRVVSIVGRYLEHARIFIFGSRVYIGSADMMTRNTTRRVEVLTPIRDPRIAAWLSELVQMELRDNVKASEMLSDGRYKKRESDGVPFDSQIEIFQLFEGAL